MNAPFRHIVSATLVVLAASFLLSGCATHRGGAVSAGDALASWNENAPARVALVAKGLETDHGRTVASAFAGAVPQKRV